MRLSQEIRISQEEEIRRALGYAEDILYKFEELIRNRPIYSDINPVTDDIIISWANDYERLKKMVRSSRRIVYGNGPDSRDAMKAVSNTLNFAMILEEKYSVEY